MSSEPKPTPKTRGDGEQQLFELLDRYVETLHEANFKSRSELLSHHGELADLLECLDALDSLAVPVSLRSADNAGSAVDTGSAVDAGSADDGPSGSDVGSTIISDSYGAPVESADPADSSPTLEMPSPVTTDFGKYRLEDEIGRGGMGVVYRAWQPDLDRAVALKMILSSRLASADDVRRFYSEAKAAGSIRHPNIVGIHEVGQIHGQHYFTMDYVEGRSLSELIVDGPFDVERAARCVAAVARAVHYLHQAGIVHRDLKPSNILIDADGTPYVTDFGLAKVFTAESAQTQTGTIVGTPSYMSPEQAAGRTSEIGPHSDVYSLGAILYELLCGRPPFQEKTPLDTLVQVLEGEPTIVSRLNRRVPRELELISMRCLEKDPRNRYRSAEDLADDLERYLRREPVEARPSGIVHKLRRWGRREPALVSRLVGLAAVAGIVQLAYIRDPVDVDVSYHVEIMSILGLWAVVSFAFQKMLHRASLANFTRFGWAAADAVLLTMLLVVTRGPLGPLLIAYPLLVAASGLFFRVRLVLFMTAACLISYGILLAVHPEQWERSHYPFIFASVLAVLGFIVAYQVYRVRVLSRYYDRRGLP